jgi:hypothetical protein
MASGTMGGMKLLAVEEEFWTEHIQLLTAQFPTYYTKPQKVWGRFHTSEEMFTASRNEIIPTSKKAGKRSYVMMQPYVNEPKLTITVGFTINRSTMQIRRAPWAKP